MRFPRMTARRLMLINVFIAVSVCAGIRIDKMFRLSHTVSMAASFESDAKEKQDEASAYLRKAVAYPAEASIWKHRADKTTREAEELMMHASDLREDLQSEGWYRFP